MRKSELTREKQRLLWEETHMKKFKEFFKKYACNASAILLTGVLAGVATRGCYFVYYQPEVPENLKNFSKNK